MWVRPTRKGYYADRLREPAINADGFDAPGASFEIPDSPVWTKQESEARGGDYEGMPVAFSPKWMVEDKEKSTRIAETQELAKEEAAKLSKKNK